MSAAAEAAAAGLKVTVVESDLHLGGQLVKQTHKFFGSKDEYAGTRGYKIAGILLEELDACKDNLDIHINTTITGYYPEDKVFTAMRGEEELFQVRAKNRCRHGSSGAPHPVLQQRPPGVYGAGAVQTLMNVYGSSRENGFSWSGRAISASSSATSFSGRSRGGRHRGGRFESRGYWVHAAKVRRLASRSSCATPSEGRGRSDDNGSGDHGA